MSPRARRLIAAAPLFLLRASIALSRWWTDTADLLWHRLRLWRDPVPVARPAYTHEVITPPGGTLHDYSRPLAEDEGWPEEGVDPLADAVDVPENKA